MTCCTTTTKFYLWNGFISLGSLGFSYYLFAVFRFQLLLLLNVAFFGVFSMVWMVSSACCGKTECWKRWLMAWNVAYCMCFTIATALQFTINELVNAGACYGESTAADA